MSTYVSSIALRQARTVRRNQNMVRMDNQLRRLGPVSQTLLFAVIVSLLGLIYLTQITKTSSYGYQINEQKTKKEQLIEENESLAVEAARLQSIERVKNSKVAKELVQPSAVTFAESVQ